ncbi:MAG: cation diffusion facilitator family transporter [Candidatus Omnitrophota bacterium]|nr:MAG: cation diffusion facilitator family transporter [Candidatus Omnitrophota bacterium]
MKRNNHSLPLQISWFSIVVNIFLVAVKFLLGVLSNSISILSDAVHSLSDACTTGVVIFSLHASKKPPDRIHPFGHGRAEDIGGLILSILLLLAGINFLKDSIVRLFFPLPVEVNILFIGFILGAALLKLLLGIFTQRISKKANCPLLETDAFHHYSDCVTSFAVAGGLLFVKRGSLYIDSLLGAIISLVIIFWAQKTARQFINNLIGRGPSLFLRERIREIAYSFQFVEGVHDIEVHSYGKNNIISLHIELDSSLSLEEAHSIADSIEKRVYSENLGRCIVHVDLRRSAKPIEKKKIEKLIKRLKMLTKSVKDFHGVEIITTEERSILNFHLLLDKSTSLEKSHVISHRLSSLLQKKFNFSQVNIHIEPYERKVESSK